MVRSLCFVGVFLGGLFALDRIVVGETTVEPRAPLDLPSGAVGDGEDEEDEPESIVFYGAEYEGDGFFWCLDKSCSMDGTQILVLKQEVTQAVQSLSRNADMGLVAFSTNVVTWQTAPVKATISNKLGAINWVQTLAAGGGTIIGPAGIATLNIANQSSRRQRTVIVLGDGRPSDESEALANITSANYQSIPINTILIQDVNGIEFMQSLSSMNHGTYRFIP